MPHTLRASRRVPKPPESKTVYERGELLRKDWQKFPRPRCRPSRSSSHQIVQAGGAVLQRLSCRAKLRRLAKLTDGYAAGFLDFAWNDPLEHPRGVNWSLMRFGEPACKS